MVGCRSQAFFPRVLVSATFDIILTRINLLLQPYGCGHSLCRPDRVEMVRIGGQERVWTPWILGFVASIDGSLTTTH